MKCTNCGREIDTSWKFCRYCGKAIISAGVLEKEERNSKKNNREKPNKHKKLWIPIAAILCLFLCIAAVLFFKRIMPDLNQSQNNPDEPVESSADIDLPRLDANTYFEERSEVISVVDATKSASVLTEKQVTEDLTNRGFDAFPITTDYSMNGDFYSDSEVSPASSEKHPVYTTYHITSAGEYWTIYEINGSVMAYPVSYNLQSTRGVQVLIAESSTVMSYDSEKNQFYETIPDSNALVVITVNRVDSECLESLTSNVLDAM